MAGRLVSWQSPQRNAGQDRRRIAQITNFHERRVVDLNKDSSNPDAANINGSAVEGVIALSFALPLLIFPTNGLLQIGAGEGNALALMLSGSLVRDKAQ